MKRRLFNAAAVVSLVLFLVILGLWLRSCFYNDFLQLPATWSETGWYGLESRRGHACFWNNYVPSGTYIDPDDKSGFGWPIAEWRTERPEAPDSSVSRV